MSVNGYFKKSKPDLTMPKTESGADNLGIRYEGAVLTGHIGVNQQLERQSTALPQTSAQIRELAPGGLTYIQPNEYLLPREDTRCVPDPVYAAQRDNLGGRYDLTDPVLRHHMNLPPLPDPYEERRR